MAPPPTNEQKIAEAKKIAESDSGKAESLYKEVLEKPPGSNEAALRDYENALVGLGELYKGLKRQEDLAELVKASRSALTTFAKAKTAKLGMAIGQRRRAIANSTQSDNCLICSLISPILSRSRSQQPNPA
jgi:26S proteasome regulatory subunit N6